ncbi:MAG: response regulator [Planctomycetota bacterium]
MIAAEKVLIVEDENIVQLHLQVLVQELGYAVSGTAASADEALLRAAEDPPQLVLMDIGLPGGRDGIAAARELVARHDLAVVFLTAYADAETIDRAQEIGAAGYVVKPFSKPQLRAALSTAFAGRKNLRRARESEGSLAAVRPARGAAAIGPADGGPRPFGAGTRLAIFSHDTMGLGHLQRCLNVARALARRFPGLSILLLTGSPAVNRFTLPAGLDYVKLPAVRKVGSERYEARYLGLTDAAVLELRKELTLRAIQGFAPHVLLVDHAPTGMGGELRPALAWLKESRPECVTVIGLRDVLDHPDDVIEHWNQNGTYGVLQNLYDHVLIYGIPAVFDPVSAYRFPPALAAKARFCHYVREPREDGEAAKEPAPAGAKPRVVVTIGGGDGGGELVIGTYLEMLRRHAAEIGFESLLLTGPFLPPELLARFRAEVEGLPATLLEFVPSTTPHLERADLVVSTGGYNTITQTLAYGKRSIVIPRVLHRREQILRAERLAEMGLVTLLRPEEVTPDRLFATIGALLADPALPLADARARTLVPLDGAEQVAEFCAGLTVADPSGGGMTPGA